MSRECPIHKCEFDRKKTKYGLRYNCPREDCTVVWWDGPTSTPADAETREARQAAHRAFDGLWKGKNPVMSRKKAFELLRDVLDRPPTTAHIGMCDKDECERVEQAAKERAENA